MSEPDLLGWFDKGATALLQAIVDAPDDLTAFVFLKNAPAPKVFWTRRQCHETTIHAVDALAAALGRFPRGDDAGWITDEIALDGIDELLTVFLPRPVSRLRSTSMRTLSRLSSHGSPGPPMFSISV